MRLTRTPLGEAQFTVLKGPMHFLGCYHFNFFSGFLNFKLLCRLESVLIKYLSKLASQNSSA